VKPQVIVCLGATAARAVISKDFKVSLQRGKFVDSPYAPSVFATFHPSALLRLQDDKEKEAAFGQFVKDLSLIRKGLLRP
jgi:DNA polymerase